MTRQRLPSHHGFTIVELLVVVAIIGIIAGITVPAVMFARTRVIQASVKMDVDSIANAIEQYRAKYKDYFPDGSNWTVFEKHLRRAFPTIDQSEMDLLNPALRNLQANWPNPARNDSEFLGTNLPASEMRVMEPAEALVFFLGGFSDNPRRPFTGDGGPFVLSYDNQNRPIGCQYNSSRKNAFYDFDASRLTVYVNHNGMTVSYDETGKGNPNVPNDPENQDKELGLPDAQAGGALINDCLPVYRSRYTKAPIVYFDHRTYGQKKGSGYYYNRFVIGLTNDTARPLKSDTALTTGGVPAGVDAADRRYKYMMDQKFQLISPGLDGFYGGFQAAAPFVQPVLHRFPSGDSDVAALQFKNFSFVMGAGTNPQLDNCANFSDTLFANGLPQ